MARALRIEYPGAFYHVMNRGQGRRKIFLDDKGRQNFLELLAETARLWKLGIAAYCLMGNHYHLLVTTPVGGLSRAMRHLDGIYTQRFNRAHRRDGPLFRGRYKAILIDAEEYFLSVVRYIHRNPKGAGLVSDIDHYRWSSHWEYLHKKQCAEWLDRRSVISRFDGLKEYQQFMHDGMEEEIVEFYRGRYQRPVLGSKKFIEGVKDKLGDKARVEQDEPDSRRIFAVDLKQIVEATAQDYGREVGELKRRKRGGENEARMVAIFLGRYLGGHKHGEIGRMVGLENPSSVSSVYLLIKARMAKDKELVRTVRRIEKSLINSKKRT